MAESITQFYNEAYEAEMNITIPRETVQQAIDALQNDLCYLQICEAHEKSLQMTKTAITTLRTALEAKDVEPYCWLYKDDMGDCQWFFTNPPEYSKPLYAHPAPAAREPKP